ncbi:hypothetical protein EBR11_07620, partial [bacterium]|nr:hypothetical protein [bacterium]
MFNRICLLFTLIFASAYAENKEKEVRFKANFKVLSFNPDIQDLGYLEEKELRFVNINQDIISSDFLYFGKPEIEFVKIITPKPPPSELELSVETRQNAEKKLEQISDQYNKLNLQLRKINESIGNQERQPNSSELLIINEINNSMQLLAEKISKAETELANAHGNYLRNLEKAPKIETNKKKDNLKKENIPPPYEPLAKFTIPVSGGNYILIFNKTPNGVTISPLNDAPGVFPFGSYQFINLTGTTVELRFGSKVIPLNPNGRTVFKPETANGEYLEGEFWTKVDDEFKLGYKFR